MNENLLHLRRIVENAAALETEHDIPLPYVEAMRRMHGHLRASTVLALLDRIKYLEGQTRRNYQDWQIAYGRAEAAEQALDFHTQRDRELKTRLSMIADQLDEFCYDELASLIEDEPLNQWGESYTSKLQAAEAAIQRVRELAEKWISRVQGPVQWVQLLEMHYELTRALDGGEQE